MALASWRCGRRVQCSSGDSHPAGASGLAAPKKQKPGAWLWVRPRCRSNGCFHTSSVDGVPLPVFRLMRTVNFQRLFRQWAAGARIVRRAAVRGIERIGPEPSRRSIGSGIVCAGFRSTVGLRVDRRGDGQQSSDNQAGRQTNHVGLPFVMNRCTVMHCCARYQPLGRYEPLTMMNHCASKTMIRPSRDGSKSTAESRQARRGGPAAAFS